MSGEATQHTDLTHKKRTTTRYELQHERRKNSVNYPTRLAVTRTRYNRHNGHHRGPHDGRRFKRNEEEDGAGPGAGLRNGFVEEQCVSAPLLVPEKRPNILSTQN